MRKKYNTEEERINAQKETYKRYNEKHREERKEYSKKYYQEHKEKISEFKKQYYLDNKEKESEKRKQRYELNKEKELERNKLYNNKHKKEILEKSKQYYQEHKEDKKDYLKKYRETPIGRAIQLLSNYKYSDKKHYRGECTLTAKWMVDNIFSKPCHYCGETGWEIMGCDRINNDLPHTPDNVVPCCLNCNNKRQKMPYYEFMKKINK